LRYELPMANRRYELDDLLIRPGAYFNPQTEVMLIVDDSPSIDSEIFNMEEFEGADWILISDEPPIDDARRDEQLEEFQATYHGGDGRAVGSEAIENPDEPPGLDELDEEEGDELE
jgi:hypothetical protein